MEEVPGLNPTDASQEAITSISGETTANPKPNTNPVATPKCTRFQDMLTLCRNVGDSTKSNRVKYLRSSCARLSLRVLYLVPVLERLEEQSERVLEDPRSSIIFARLETELHEALEVIKECAEVSPISRVLNLGRRTLSGRIEASLSEIRQCHTECLILLGSPGVGGGLGGHFGGPLTLSASVPGSPWRNFRSTSINETVYDNITTNPMVDRSPRAYERAPPESPSGTRLRIPPPALRTRSSEGLTTAALSDASNGMPADETPAINGSVIGGRRAVTFTLSGGEGGGSGSRVDKSARELVTALQEGSKSDVRDALDLLLKLSETDEGKLQIGAAGAVPVLSVLLSMEDSEMLRLCAAKVILQLASKDENRVVIAKAGCIGAFVLMLRSGTPESRAVAAKVLWNLAINAENKVIIAASDAIPSLVAIIQSDSEGIAKQDAAEALVQLASNNERNQKAISEAGGIPSLINLLRDGNVDEMEKACLALGTLAVNNNENKLNIAGSGAAPLLLDLISQKSSAPASRAAAWTLYVLSSHQISSSYILACGGLRALKKAAVSGEPEVEHWSQYMLSVFDPEYVPPVAPKPKHMFPTNMGVSAAAANRTAGAARGDEESTGTFSSGSVGGAPPLPRGRMNRSATMAPKTKFKTEVKEFDLS